MIELELHFFFIFMPNFTKQEIKTMLVENRRYNNVICLRYFV